jgi:hypothetical protein
MIAAVLLVVGLSVANYQTRVAINLAIRSASAALENPRCAGLINDFGLSAPVVEVTPSEYVLRYIYFIDGQPQHCGPHVAFYTSPGSRVVYACSGTINRQRPSLVTMLVIHEMLHSYGLQEAPAKGALTSEQITVEVQRRCGR